MVIDSNWVNIFLINNYTVRFVGIVSYVKHNAILGTTINP